MKKIFAGVVLPTLAAVAVIGSGFSVWFFGENQDKVSTDASVQVEYMIRIGNLKMDATNMKLNLDQTKAVRDFIIDSNNGYISSATNGNLDKKSNYNATAFGANTASNGVYLTADAGFDGYILIMTTADMILFLVLINSKSLQHLNSLVLLRIMSASQQQMLS